MKVNLCYQQIIDDDVCEACGSSKETSGHLFWECETACEVWSSLALVLKRVESSIMNLWI